MIDQIDRSLLDWVRDVLGPVPVSLSIPSGQALDQGVLLRLVDVQASASARTMARATALPPLKGFARYMVTTHAPDPLEAHRMLGELFFCALETNALEIEVEPITVEQRGALGLRDEPGFLIRVPIQRPREAPAVSFVREMLIQHAPLVRLSGVVLGPDEQPIPGATVELPALQVTARSDLRGRWQFQGIPAEPRSRRLRVRAKGCEISVTTDAAAPNDEPVVIRFAVLES